MTSTENCNISQVLSEIVAQRPQAPALTVKKGLGYRTWSFAELGRQVDRYAHGLTAAGIGRGQRVVLMVTPSLDFVALTFALFKIGAVVILIDPGMGYRNLLRCIESVRPEAFIGIRRAQLFKHLFPKPFATVRTSLCVGRSFGLFGRTLASCLPPAEKPFDCVASRPDDLAAIIFTTGSTGPPKGVRYEHAIFFAQLQLIRKHYGIRPEDIDQPAFPLFALFSTALGACAVIPDMNPAHPARVKPQRFIRTILDQQVSYSFGSPAIWNVVSRYCLARDIRLPSLKKVLMAGAPVSGELIDRVRRIMAADGEIHTPYGATESLPIVSMTGSEILAETWKLTRTGHGTCVGRPLPGIEVKVIEIADGPIPDWQQAQELPQGSIGEIVVRGPVVTRAYENNPRENALAKIVDQDSFWHRIGDCGYFDTQGRLWFCGRKAHRVLTGQGTMFTIPCEAIFNEHPLVARSALVGVGEAGLQRPVLVVEPAGRVQDAAGLFGELRQLALDHEHTKDIETFLIHAAFPVDIRHNAKIFREKLAVWAAEQIKGEVVR